MAKKKMTKKEKDMLVIGGVGAAAIAALALTSGGGGVIIPGVGGGGSSGAGGGWTGGMGGGELEDLVNWNNSWLASVQPPIIGFNDNILSAPSPIMQDANPSAPIPSGGGGGGFWSTLFNALPSPPPLLAPTPFGMIGNIAAAATVLPQAANDAREIGTQLGTQFNERRSGGTGTAQPAPAPSAQPNGNFSAGGFTYGGSTGTAQPAPAQNTQPNTQPSGGILSNIAANIPRPSNPFSGIFGR